MRQPVSPNTAMRSGARLICWSSSTPWRPVIVTCRDASSLNRRSQIRPKIAARGLTRSAIADAWPSTEIDGQASPAQSERARSDRAGRRGRTASRPPPAPDPRASSRRRRPAPKPRRGPTAVQSSASSSLPRRPILASFRWPDRVLDLLTRRPVLRRHEGRRQALPHHLAGTGRRDRAGDRPDAAAAQVRGARFPHAGRRRARDPHHGRARRAADRRRGGLWRGARHGGRSIRRKSETGLRRAARLAPHRGQPALGARRPARAAGADTGGQAPRRGLQARGRDLRRGCRRGCRDLPAHRRERARPDPQAEAEGRASQCVDPLQRGLARHRRLGHRAGADLPGAQCGPADPCLGRGDAAEKSRRLAHPPGNSASTACRTR